MSASRAELDAAVIAWAREPDWRDDEARFDSLARALFAHQFAHCAPYRRFCEGRDVDPDRLTDWRLIPPVPTGAFKEVALRAFPEAGTQHVFRTSGTSTDARGALHLDTLAVYEASLEASFRRHLLPDVAPGDRIEMHALAPATHEAPDSSLSHMFDTMLARAGAPESSHWVVDGELDIAHARRTLGRLAASERPVLLGGTAFAFVHLLEALDAIDERFPLPAGTRVMETGGFKGRSRSVTRDDLHAWIERRLGVPPSRIVNQYGMTELGSQFYDAVLRDPTAPRRKTLPPWTRVRCIEPGRDSHRANDVALGEVGRLVVYDLANTGSVLAVETADLGRWHDGGFEVLGREPGAEERGCSIALDAMLGEARA
ncbi:MAG: hypothetical protein AAF430_06540 [Myxococcota bacterium]